MTKQNEIREGVGRFLKDLGFRGLTANEQREILFKYLHSQGVVIKVERELPGVILSKEMSDKDKWYKKTVWEYAQETMLKAGYVAVEPLIKEGE